ncbi:MAG: spore coat associated protein CotJA [Clostridia bacterium]|nr:spore coat associated protein CotJA [Clostridia bacterium]
MVLGMAYVRPQIWEDLYDTEDAFRNGTIFRGLDYPFMGRGGNKE